MKRKKREPDAEKPRYQPTAQEQAAIDGHRAEVLTLRGLLGWSQSELAKTIAPFIENIEYLGFVLPK